MHENIESSRQQDQRGGEISGSLAKPADANTLLSSRVMVATSSSEADGNGRHRLRQDPHAFTLDRATTATDRTPTAAAICSSVFALTLASRALRLPVSASKEAREPLQPFATDVDVQPTTESLLDGDENASEQTGLDDLEDPVEVLMKRSRRRVAARRVAIRSTTESIAGCKLVLDLRHRSRRARSTPSSSRR
jgi:hypothetical protein